MVIRERSFDEVTAYVPTFGNGRAMTSFISHSVFSSSLRFSPIIWCKVYIIFALPDYSSEVIERHQNVFYGRLIHLALEFDIHQQRGKTDSKGKSGETLHYTKPQ